VLGNPKAPVTLIEFADLQCPYCGYVATKGALPTVIDKYVRTGKVKLQMNLLGFLGEDSRTAALVAAAASQENKMFQFSDAFFANQKEENTGYVTNEFLGSIASKAGLNPDKVLARAKGDKAEGLVNQWSTVGHTANISGTPSFFVQKGDGGVATQIRVNLDDVSTFSGPLDDALRG
jgi:protein-disulfide isomerase